jgi:hypothetical protein
MKRSTFLTITSIIGILFGVGLGIYPQQMMEQNGVDFGAETIIVVRALAGMILGVSIGTWFARNAPASDALKGILWIIVLTHGAALVVDLYYYAGGYLTQAIIGSSVLHILLGGGAFYYLVRMKPEQTAVPIKHESMAV